MHKKLILLFVLLFFLSACGKKEDTQQTDGNVVIVSKVDENEDYLYFKNYKSVNLSSGEKFDFNVAIFNINSSDVSSVNMELKNMIVKYFRSLKYDRDLVVEGTLISFDVFESSSYISLIANESYYFGNDVHYKGFLVYVISKDTGKLMDNIGLMNAFSIDEDSMFTHVKDISDDSDIDYSIMMMRNNGYKLYVNEDNKLIAIFNESNDNESVKKELVVN